MYGLLDDLVYEISGYLDVESRRALRNVCTKFANAIPPDPERRLCRNIHSEFKKVTSTRFDTALSYNPIAISGTAAALLYANGKVVLYRYMGNNKVCKWQIWNNHLPGCYGYVVISDRLIGLIHKGTRFAKVVNFDLKCIHRFTKKAELIAVSKVLAVTVRAQHRLALDQGRWLTRLTEIVFNIVNVKTKRLQTVRAVVAADSHTYQEEIDSNPQVALKKLMISLDERSITIVLEDDNAKVECCKCDNVGNWHYNKQLSYMCSNSSHENIAVSRNGEFKMQLNALSSSLYWHRGGNGLESATFMSAFSPQLPTKFMYIKFLHGGQIKFVEGNTILALDASRKNILIYNCATRKAQQKLQYKHPIIFVEVSPCWKHIVLINSKGKAIFLEAKKRLKMPKTSKLQAAPPDQVTVEFFSNLKKRDSQ